MCVIGCDVGNELCDIPNSVVVDGGDDACYALFVDDRDVVVVFLFVSKVEKKKNRLLAFACSGSDEASGFSWPSYYCDFVARGVPHVSSRVGVQVPIRHHAK